MDVCYSVGDEQNSKDTTTPLIEAALSSNEKVVTYLLKHGASVNFPKVRLVITCFAFFLKVVEILMPWNFLTTLDWNVLDKRNLLIFCFD